MKFMCALFFIKWTNPRINMNVWSTVQTEVRFKLLCLHPEQKYEYDDWICVARFMITNDAICVHINTFDFPLFVYKIGEWNFFFSFLPHEQKFVNECFFFRFFCLSLSSQRVFYMTLVGDVRNARFYYILHSIPTGFFSCLLYVTIKIPWHNCNLLIARVKMNGIPKKGFRHAFSMKKNAPIESSKVLIKYIYQIIIHSKLVFSFLDKTTTIRMWIWRRMTFGLVSNHF